MAKLRADRPWFAFVEAVALAVCKKGVTDGFEQKSDTMGLQFLLAAESAYPPIWAQELSLEDGRWEHVEGLI